MLYLYFIKQQQTTLKKTKVMKYTIEEAANIINNEFEACNASVEGKTIEIGYRAKKSNKIFIENGEVSFIGNCNDIACKIADRFELVKNF